MRGIVGRERIGKEMDRCPITVGVGLSIAIHYINRL
jgi:hypothetical protein